MERATSKDGTAIAYRRTGAGPALILVHGTCATSARWAAVLPALERHFSVYALDRRGRGESGDTAPYAIEREYEDVVAVVHAIGDAVCVLGHSFGGICALEAAMQTKAIRRLVVYEPPVTEITLTDPLEGIVARVDALLQAGDSEGALTAFLSEVVRMPARDLESIKSSPNWLARVATAHTLPREMTGQRCYRFEHDRFKALKTPTLLLLGGDSPSSFKSAIAVLAAALPNRRVVVMPGQQHIAMDTAPDMFVREVLDFLSEPN